MRNTICKYSGLLGLLALLLIPFAGSSQGNKLVVNMGLLEGTEVTPQNVFSFQVMNGTGLTKQATLKGTLHFRNSRLQFGWTLRAVLNPGNNLFTAQQGAGAVWTYSEPALRELFQTYGKLPQGTYEYCVEVKPDGPGGEVIAGDENMGCVYQKVDDIFLINLTAPEDKARLYESNPQFSWVVNYPFASALTYRIRVAEQKTGQNPQNAVTRNNAVYQDRNIAATNTLYPLTAKPLQKFQPYVWTVDAYYKGILLGGAEAWRFMIVDDSVLKALPRESHFVDISLEGNMPKYYAVGVIKIKYEVKDEKSDNLKISISRPDGSEIVLKHSTYGAGYGDNRIELNLKENLSFKHLGKYKLKIISQTGREYFLDFIYVNPELL